MILSNEPGYCEKDKFGIESESYFCKKRKNRNFLRI